MEEEETVLSHHKHGIPTMSNVLVSSSCLMQRQSHI